MSGVRAPRVVRANRIGRQGSDPDRRIRHGPAPRRFWFLASHFGSGPLPVRALKRLRADPAVGRDGRGRRQGRVARRLSRQGPGGGKPSRPRPAGAGSSAASTRACREASPDRRLGSGLRLLAKPKAVPCRCRPTSRRLMSAPLCRAGRARHRTEFRTCQGLFSEIITFFPAGVTKNAFPSKTKGDGEVVRFRSLCECKLRAGQGIRPASPADALGAGD